MATHTVYIKDLFEVYFGYASGGDRFLKISDEDLLTVPSSKLIEILVDKDTYSYYYDYKHEEDAAALRVIKRKLEWRHLRKVYFNEWFVFGYKRNRVVIESNMGRRCLYLHHSAKFFEKQCFLGHVEVFGGELYLLLPKIMLSDEILQAVADICNTEEFKKAFVGRRNKFKVYRTHFLDVPVEIPVANEIPKENFYDFDMFKFLLVVTNYLKDIKRKIVIDEHLHRTVLNAVRERFVAVNSESEEVVKSKVKPKILPCDFYVEHFEKVYPCDIIITTEEEYSELKIHQLVYALTDHEQFMSSQHLQVEFLKEKLARGEINNIYKKDFYFIILTMRDGKIIKIYHSSILRVQNLSEGLKIRWRSREVATEINVQNSIDIISKKLE
jgi:hypothetical protein